MFHFAQQGVGFFQVALDQGLAKPGEGVNDVRVLQIGLAGVIGLDHSHLADRFAADPGGLQAEPAGAVHQGLVIAAGRLGHHQDPVVPGHTCPAAENAELLIDHLGAVGELHVDHAPGNVGGQIEPVLADVEGQNRWMIGVCRRIV